jgi:2,3-bisphosphoglycerate-independent phosphoglycerate mutase
MADHSAGHITTEEAAVLIAALSRRLGSESLQFHAGVSYRHLLVCKGVDFKVKTFPPHDNIGRPVTEILPTGVGAELLRELMAKSAELFKGHEVNKARISRGKSPVSSIWLWGQGRQLALEAFRERFGLTGAAVTAVDLIRGLATLVGFDVIEVSGATGFFDTNYEGKAAAAINALKDHDLAFIHVEAPDEASHAGDAEIKKKSIECIDRLVVAPVLEALRGYPEWRILVLPDHPTLVRTRGHSGGFVPFVMAGTGIDASGNGPFSEASAAKTGLCMENGHELMRYFLEG